MRSTRTRRVTRRSARPVAPTTLDHFPEGLSAEDRDWLLTRAHLAGGLTEAFVHLVRLNILADAMLETSAKMQRIEAALVAQGWPRLEALDRADALLDRRLGATMTRRLLHSANWTRPGPGESRHLYDDPALPLPHMFTRRLIREGRAYFDATNLVWRTQRRCR